MGKNVAEKCEQCGAIKVADKTCEGGFRFIQRGRYKPEDYIIITKHYLSIDCMNEYYPENKDSIPIGASSGMKYLNCRGDI